MKNMSKKHIKLQRYHIYASGCSKKITQRQIANCRRYGLTLPEFQYLINDSWSLFTFRR